MPTYPPEQLHRISFTKLTESQIAEKLAGVAGPTSASPLSDVLVGRSLRIVTDNGPTLEYEVASVDRLMLSENGGGGVEAGYGALALDQVVFFSHLVPGTQRGYHVVIDDRTKLATVIETWFSGEVYSGTGENRQLLDYTNREVQREIYFGYLDDGGEAPAERHHRSNRIEGKGFYWKQDTGIETIELYPSTWFSNFVELTRLGGELGFCAPTDYIRIDEDYYIYSRTECEFSGVMTTYVLNVNTVEQVGMRLGFDASDALEYYVFRGTGEWVGQIAQFERFGDTRAGAEPPLPQDGSPLPKGYRRAYRPMLTYTKMSKEEVAAAAQNAHVFESRGMAGNASPPTDHLAGKALTLRWDDGVAIQYEFVDMQTLRWRREGEGGWTEERYQAWESAPGLYMFGHLMTGAPNQDCQIVAADLHHGLATLMHGAMGTPYINNEAAVRVVFGVVEMEGLVPPKYRRHQFTDELVGRAITWNYSQETGLTSMHVYTTPHSLSWVIFSNGAGGSEWSGPSAQIKIRDGIYMAYWLEEACNGTLGTYLVNLRTMHDCGVGYHCGPDGLSLSAVGGHARHAGRFDIARFFEIKA